VNEMPSAMTRANSIKSSVHVRRVSPATLAATVLFFAVMLFAAAAGAQTPVTVGYRDFSFGTALNTPTGEKAESKLWFNDGLWWASLWNAQAGQHRIYRFNTSTQSWTDTGTAIDPRSSSRADVLWDAAESRLYVASHYFSTSASATNSSSQWARLYRYTYNSTLKLYTLEAGFPVNITRGKCEVLTIAKDAGNRLWITFVESGRVKINWSMSGDLDWGVPVDLPLSATAIDTANDDISAIVGFPDGDVGVMWTNQSTDSVYFARHRSVDSPTVWQALETVLPNVGCTGNCADDHLSLKTDQSGRVFAAVKTSLDDDDEPLIVLAVRDSGWTIHTVAVTDDHQTRPVLVLDEQHQLVHVFATIPEGGGAIHVKTSSLGNIQFSPGFGDLFIDSATDLKINNVTGSKQNVTSETGLLMLASDQDSNFYLHNFISLGGQVPTPPNPPTNLNATAIDSTHVGLTWTDASNNETAFHIERATGAGAFGQIATVGANVSSFNDQTAEASTTYRYQVRARNTQGYSDYSNIDDATTPAPPPGSPTSLSATPVSGTRIDLAWTDGSTDETAFHIERALATGAFGEIATVDPNVTTYSDDPVSSGVTYRYRVRAANGTLFSGYSNIATVTTPGGGGGGIKTMTFEAGTLNDPATGADTVRGTMTVETVTPLKGAHSARVAGVVDSYLEEDFTAAGDLYVSFYLRLVALPASDVRVVLLSSGGTTVGNIVIRNTGRLRLRVGSTTIGAESAPLVVGQLYRVGLHQRAGGGANAVAEAFLASGDQEFGAAFAATATGTWTTPADRMKLGATAGGVANLIVDDATLNILAMPGPSQ
jgi:hypothetical protein